MAKRDKGSAGTTTAAGMEQQLLGFAEQLGRMAGTLQVKADGWIDRDALDKQLTSLRKGAADLLQHFSAGAQKAKKKTAPAPARKATTGRSGGTVDAPGKKHRTPAPAGPAVRREASQAAKLRAAKTMEKTNRRRGRG